MHIFEEEWWFKLFHLLIVLQLFLVSQRKLSNVSRKAHMVYGLSVKSWEKQRWEICWTYQGHLATRTSIHKINSSSRNLEKWTLKLKIQNLSNNNSKQVYIYICICFGLWFWCCKESRKARVVPVILESQLLIFQFQKLLQYLSEPKVKVKHSSLGVTLIVNPDALWLEISKNNVRWKWKWRKYIQIQETRQARCAKRARKIIQRRAIWVR